ncbi:TetR/AcrR family transcriptional regulator [Nisaea sp.]|uniref:TetR/AcrR family transcriptional regulator n=1 Tax=Nisaea sp. TaxID=2024842 RepID=UPI0032671D02
MAGEARSEKSRAGRPSKEQAAATSLRIIETAAGLFAAQGFAATSMEQVASACNAGKDTIYRRYASKLELFAAVVEHTRTRVLERLEGDIDAVADKGDSLSRVKHVARWFLTVNLDPDLLAFRRIALSEGTVFGQGAQNQPTDDPIMARLIYVVSAAQQDGVLRGGDATFLAWHLLHCIVFGPSNDAMLGHSTYETVEAQDAYFEKAWDLFLHGVMSR